MSREIIYDQIKDRIFKMGFNSVNLRLSLIREDNRWKIFLMRAIFELGEPRGKIVHHQQDDFIIEDISMSVDDFSKFLDYLKRMELTTINFENDMVFTNDKLLYTVGNNQLCFAGS